MKRKIFKVVVLLKILIISLLFYQNSFAQNLPTKLTLNKPLNAEIKGGESHFYSINLSVNQTARIEIIQKGVDVELFAFNPKGEKYIESWSPGGLFGNDLILVTATEVGEYKIEVTPFLPRAELGKYTITLKKIRPLNSEDIRINGATRLIKKLAFDAASLRGNGTLEGKLGAIKKWGDIIELSKIKKDKVWEGSGFGTQGVIFHSIGEFQKALDAYLKSLEIWKQIGNRQYQGTMINNIGMIYQDLGEYEKSISYLEQSLNFHKKMSDEKGFATALGNLASSYLRLEDYEKAKELYLQTIAIEENDKSYFGKRKFAKNLHSLGATLLFNNEVKEGQKYIVKALELRREIKDIEGLANSLLIVGKAQWDSGFKEEGYKNLKESWAKARTIGDKVLQAEALYFLAIAEREKGSIKNLEKAIEYAGMGLSSIELIRSKIVGSKSRYGYFSTVQKYYDLYIDLTISHHQKTKDKQDIGIALRISELSRSRSLLDLLNEAKVGFKQGINLKLVENVQKLQKELNNKYAIRRQILGTDSNAQQIRKINDEINELNTNIKKLKLRIRRENPKYADLTEARAVSLEEMHKLLDDESVLLEYKLGDKRSFVWLVTKDSIEYFILPPRKEIEAKARSFYELVVANKRSNETKREKASKELSGILFSQFAGKLANRRLVIVADGVLQYTPFSALVNSKNTSQNPNSKTQHLIETNEIVMLPSASVLSQIRQNPNKSKTEKIAIFADPVFDLGDSRIAVNTNSKPSVMQNILIRQVLRDFQFGETLPRLLASRQEAREISRLFGEDKSDVRIDFAANVENIETTNLSQYKILHFATHGLINTTRPELSGLVFSLYGKNGQEQNGFLSLNEIYNLQLSSDMVVLSACQTAFGKDVKGEGLIGLSRGFLYAGSNRVIASYWKVDDFATAEFMNRFYRNYLEKKMPASKALQQTKIEMKKIRRYQSPYYWSAFTLLGDWK